MKQDISSLMDGELEAPEAERIIRACGASEDHKDTWNAYHLIGDVMRGQQARSVERGTRIVQALRQEPTVLGPKARVLETTFGRVALAAAASVATIGMVSWIGTQGGAPGVPGAAAPVVAKGASGSAPSIQPVSATTTVVPPAQSQPQPTIDVQDYLAAHRQIPAASAYRPVANRGDAAAR